MLSCQHLHPVASFLHPATSSLPTLGLPHPHLEWDYTYIFITTSRTRFDSVNKARQAAAPAPAPEAKAAFELIIHDHPFSPGPLCIPAHVATLPHPTKTTPALSTQGAPQQQQVPPSMGYWQAGLLEQQQHIGVPGASILCSLLL
jgi:hypothetical protein